MNHPDHKSILLLAAIILGWAVISVVGFLVGGA